jgi:hypothetical protein
MELVVDLAALGMRRSVTEVVAMGCHDSLCDWTFKREVRCDQATARSLSRSPQEQRSCAADRVVHFLGAWSEVRDESSLLRPDELRITTSVG